MCLRIVYNYTIIHGKLCIVKWTCIENISNFTALPETECDKTGTLRLDCSNNFYDLVPHLWSPPHAVSDLFRFQSFEAPLVFDLSLAILHVGFSTPSRCPHKPLSVLRKGKNLLFQRLWWLPLIRQPVSIWRVPSGLRLPATQHGPSTAVHIYREDTPLPFQQNDISTSHYYPWTKNVVLGHVVELTLLGIDCLHFLTLRLRCHAYAMQVFLPCSNHIFWCTVGTDYMCDALFLEYWSICLPPSLLIHLLYWLFFQTGLQQMCPGCPFMALWKLRAVREDCITFSPVSFHMSHYRHHRQLEKHLVSAFNLIKRQQTK